MSVEFPGKLKFLFEPHRYKVLHGGRGSAKSWGIARALLILAAQRPLRILCTREVQKSIKDSVHRLLTDQGQALGLGAFYEVLETEIRGRNGSLFLFSGLAQHTVESIKSFEGVDIVWVEEAQVVTKRSWDVLLPTIRKNGSEVWLSLNPDMETDETYQRFVASPPMDAVVVQMNWRDNPWFPEVLEKERQETLRRDRDNYDNIWEGKPRLVSEGAIYKAEIEALHADGRIRPVPYDPILPVHTVWDLGWNDAMTIGFFQRSNAEVRCIDYIEDTHRTLDWYVGEIEKRRWRWGTDFIPHDGRSRNFQTGKSTEEALQAMSRNVVVLPALDVEEGIKAARMMFPRVYFDQDKTARLLECLKRYQRAINQTTREPMGPLHDEFSHGCLVGDSLVLTGRGEVPIRDVAIGDRVWTPNGWSAVLNAGMTKYATELIEIRTACGRVLTCTPEHKILTQRGFDCAGSLRYDDRIYKGLEWQCVLSKLISMAIGTGFRATITGETIGVLMGRPTCIERFGSFITAPLQKALRFITSTATRSTTMCQTLSVSPCMSISESTCSNESPEVKFSRRLRKLWKRLLSGTSQTRAVSGTAKTPPKPGENEHGIRSIASSAASRFLRLTLRAPSSAMRIAGLSRFDNVEVPVYDLTVSKNACYQANGLMVSNSDMFRYAGMAVDQMGSGAASKPIVYKKRMLA